jgi:carbamate kinase
VDKDFTSALLAEAISADRLLLLTDVDAVYAGWGTADAMPIREAAPADLHAMSFKAGSMAPKVEAACRFVERTAGVAAIGNLMDALEMLRETKGTIVRRPSGAG